ncbi:MAG: bifunctional 4-hydroxy-2-oxoglutarate aldolase/2-dehydro-3-deoxy-phosphogluconate aldolase [Anaerolineae bacterium]|nr:bifunctional 4-hydroxy-2-oxoglutarate aldolase/2-dehydro-3-deoxy-phosphogluconate aldolase [Anaerolineae bacterium]
MNTMSLREEAVHLTKTTGVLPAIKLKDGRDLLPYAQALYDGGIRVMEVTMTTPGVLDAFRAIKHDFGGKLHLASGTTLTAAAAYAAIQAGVSIIVSPSLDLEVAKVAHTYQVAFYPGAYTAREVLDAMQAGAHIVKIFPAALAGPRYMLNLKMVYPEVNLVPSGGVSIDTAAEYIRCGACAISGARNFVDAEQIAQHGTGWITEQARHYLALVAEARATAYPLP